MTPMNFQVLNEPCKHPYLRSPEWKTKIEADMATEGGLSYHADVYRNQALVCRISLTGAFADHEAAQQALGIRLSHWLAEYEERDHMGNAGWRVLQP